VSGGYRHSRDATGRSADLISQCRGRKGSPAGRERDFVGGGTSSTDAGGTRRADVRGEQDVAVTVVRRRVVAEDVVELTLARSTAGSLPQWTPGARRRPAADGGWSGSTGDEWTAGDTMMICVSRARGYRLVLDL